MIEVMPESRGNVIGVKFSGKITTREYEETIIPRLEAVLKEHGKARLMYVPDKPQTAHRGHLRARPARLSFALLVPP